MSALHCIPDWPVIQKDLTSHAIDMGEEVSGTAFSPKVRLFSYEFDCHFDFVEHILRNFKSKTEQSLAAGRVTMGGAIAFRIEHIQTQVDLCATKFKEQLSQTPKSLLEGKKEEKSDGKDLSAKASCGSKASEIYGLTSDQQIKAIEWAKNIFLQSCKAMQPSKEKPLLQIRVAIGLDPQVHLIPLFMDSFFLRSGFVRGNKQVHFSKRDFQVFGVQQKDVKKRAETMSCYDFALLKTGELSAKEGIFGASTIKSLSPSTLKSWGYSLVTAPGKKDLVLYLDDAGRSTHLGIVLFSGKVESKPGDRSPYAYVHSLFDVPASYGRQLVFWRKTPSAIGKD